ncbi:hypothetical protein D9M69_209480 [compost metagenome]
MVDRLAVVAEAGSAIGHQALALGGAHRLAEVGLAGLAEFALATFCGVQRDHVVAHLQGGYALAHCLDDAAALVAEDAGEHALGIRAGQGVGIGVADAGRNDPDQNLASPGRLHIDFNNFERLIRSESDRCA